jgi:two-component system response regulator FlrC
VKSLATPLPIALWLDPESALSAEHCQALQNAGWAAVPVSTLDEAVDQAPHAAAIVLHLAGSTERLHVLQQQLSEAGLTTPVVCRIERQALELVVQACQQGAAHIVAAQERRSATWRALQDQVLTPRSLPAPKTVRQVVFVDPASQHLLALAHKVAQVEVTALLVGPTGSGKEVLARLLHEASPRVNGPFVALNCAAMPEHLIEDMLFGHEKGAFTGAHREHKGAFEQAQGGTLFLDEIGEMPLQLQGKLLRVLQERQLNRLGGQAAVDLDVRVVAATNKDLRQAIINKEFREDLYYRIATFRMQLLPLRERKGDIVPLALQCLRQHDPQQPGWQLSALAQQSLLNYSWPGNVRELQNVMRRAMVFCSDRLIQAEHLMFDHDELPNNLVATTSPQPIVVQPTLDASIDLSSATRLNEHQVIMATLAATPSKAEAAKQLGISPRTLRYKLAQLREHGLGMGVLRAGSLS